LQQLAELVRAPNFAGFRQLFDEALSQAICETDVMALRDAAAAAFEALLDVRELPDAALVSWFADHHKRGNVAPTQRLHTLLGRLDQKLRQQAQRQQQGALDSATTVIQTKRVVQMSWFGTAGWQSSDAFEVRRSVYRSSQERTFMRALRERFPGLLPLPNYPLDQITDLDRLRGLVPEEAWRFGRYCKLDAVLVTPIEGDPVAAFELDSRYHDSAEQQQRDQWRNLLLIAANIPLFSLRSEDPHATSVDEWYQLLTEEVLDKINVGERLRVRDVHTSLVPLHR
jgi:hypothetical protein